MPPRRAVRPGAVADENPLRLPLLRGRIVPAKDPSDGVRESAPAPPLSTLIVSPPPLYSAARLVSRTSHGSPEDVRRRLRRGPRRRRPTRLARPRGRHAGDDEDGADVLDPLREREGGFEGALHHARGEPGGPPGRDDGPRHGRTRRRSEERRVGKAGEWRWL